MIYIDQYSVISLPLELLSNDKRISTATGFFYTRNAKLFLVSNWHVFSGRNPADGQPLDSQFGAIPDAVIVPMHLKGKLGRWSKGMIADLVDENGSPTWIQHPKGQEIDIAALHIPSLPDHLVAYDVVRPDERADMAFRVGMDIFIVGFPLGIAKQGILPVWKRGSIASEPNIPVADLPLFLVDTATREGMSGSPVFIRSISSALLDNAEPEKPQQIMGPGTFTRFLGVYSGRYGADDEFSAQLGRVWHKSALEELVDGGVPGTFTLC